jgi:hypothetical protein
MGEIWNSYEVEIVNVTEYRHVMEDLRVDRTLILKWKRNSVILFVDRDQWRAHVNIESNV